MLSNHYLLPNLATPLRIGNMQESELQKYVQEHLGDLLPIRLVGWSLEPPPQGVSADSLLRIQVPSGEVVAVCGFMASPTRGKLAWVAKELKQSLKTDRQIPLVVADHLSEALQAECRELGLNYLDLSGNVRIENDHLVLLRDSQPRRFPQDKPDRNPFADKASLVLRYLFQETRAGGVRDLARSVGLNAGYTSRVVRSADELGYVRVRRDRSIQLVRPQEMLEDWTSNYHWRKNRAAHYAFSPDRGEAGLLEYLQEGRNFALTMHAGANLLDDYVNYPVRHIYCRNESDQQAIVKDLSLVRREEGAGEVVLMKPYYRESAFFDLQSPQHTPVVSDLQLYLDLFHFPVRGRDVAERILAGRLLPSLEESEDPT